MSNPKPPKRGRPPKPPGEAKTETLQYRLTPRERERIEPIVRGLLEEMRKK